jgi:hypothetical protein
MSFAEMILSMMDRHMAAWSEESDREWEGNKLHASDVATHCNRALAYRLDGAPGRPTTTATALKYKDGLDKQAVVEWAAANTGISGWIYVPGLKLAWSPPADALAAVAARKDFASPDLAFSGPSGELLLVEVKAPRAKSLKYNDLPKHEHVWQQQEYMEAARAAGYPAVFGVILYVVGDGQGAPQAFDIPAPSADERRQRWAEVAPVFHLQELPILPLKFSERQNKGSVALTAKGPWVCDYCKFRDAPCPGAARVAREQLGVEIGEKGLFFGYRMPDGSFRHNDKYVTERQGSALFDAMEPANAFWRGRLITADDATEEEESP